MEEIQPIQEIPVQANTNPLPQEESQTLEKQVECKRDERGRVLPGYTANPKGRPRGKSLKEFAREYLRDLPDEDKKAYLATLPKDIVWRMAEGNPAQDMTSGGEKIQVIPIYGGKASNLSGHNGNEEDLPAEQEN